MIPGETGELFELQDAGALRRAIEAFDPAAYDPAVMRAHAERFAVPAFQAAIAEVVDEVAPR